MGRIKESQVVTYIANGLKYRGSWYINAHGSAFGTRGVPDFITIDDDGILTGIEAKSPGEKPYVNQIRQAMKILASGGRYVVSYGDISVDDILDTSNGLPAVATGLDVGVDEIATHENFPTTNTTCEIVPDLG